MNLTEKTLTRNTVYNGLIVNARIDTAELPNGHIVKREVIEHPGGVTVAALTENDELLMVRQFRYPYCEVLLETPAGKLEKGEDPRECGIRELKEETGAVASRFEELGVFYPSPGYCAEKIHIYLATELAYEDSCPDEDEFLCVEKIPLSAAVDMVLSGEIRDGKTTAAILKLYIMKQKGLK